MKKQNSMKENAYKTALSYQNEKYQYLYQRK